MSTKRFERYLRLVFRQVPGVVWATDRDLRFTYIHGWVSKFDDAASEQLIGTTLYQFLDSADPTNPVVAHHLAALAGGRQAFEYTFRTRVYESLVEPLRNDAGAIVGCVGAAVDVTEKYESAQRLQRSVSLLTATLNATADGVLVVDREGRVAIHNQRFVEMWRLPPSLVARGDDRAMLSLASEQLEHPQTFLGHVHELYASPQEESWDVLRFKDGRVFERYSGPQRVEGQVVGRVWSFHEVTEREVLLQRTTFLADASRLLSSLDVEQALRSVAQLAVPYLGERCAIDLLRDGGPQRVLVAPADGEPDLTPELQVSALSGHSTIFSAKGRSHLAVPLLSRDTVTGVLTFVAAASRQYTRADLELVEELGRRVALSIDNARLYEGARDALANRDEFLSIAAHEIRGPLTSIHLAAQSLLRDTLPPVATRKALEVIQREDRRLARLVEDLLDLGRIRTGQLHLEIEDVDLGTVVRDVVSRLSTEIAQSGSSVTVTTNGDLAGQWDRLRLEQVVSNLLTNAIKFGEGKPIALTATTNDGRVHVEVTDHGAGIEPAMLPRIFDPFERGGGARNYGGLGLGLHIARTIVNGLGGELTVRSQPGDGATFTVDLPAVRSPAPEPAHAVGARS